MWIVVEGIDGAGKSTLIEGLSAKLLELKETVQVVREPGGTPFGEWVRSTVKGETALWQAPTSLQARRLLLDMQREWPDLKHLGSSSLCLDARTEALLFLLARADVYAVLTAQVQGWVIQDRGLWSTLAYQHDIDAQTILNWNSQAWEDRVPDWTLFLDLPPALAHERALKRSGMDRFEKRGIDFFHKARDTYLDLHQGDPFSSRLDASQSPQALLEQSWQLLESFSQRV